MNMDWFVYVLINEAGTTYTGITKDKSPARRLEEHNGLKPGGAKFTRSRGPWTLAYWETGFKNRSEAQKREHALKKDRAFKQKLKRGEIKHVQDHH